MAMIIKDIKRPPGRPRDEALQERRREAILDQAVAVFAEHGYPNGDVQWIADAIGMSKGTVYRYFPTKEDLFLAAVERGVRQLHEHTAAATASESDPIDGMVAAVRAYLKFFKSRPQLVELFIQERAEFKALRRPAYFKHRDARQGPWRQTIAALIGAGRLREIPPERVIDVLGDVLYGTMFTNHVAGRNKPFDEQAQDIVNVLFHGILADAERKRRA
jgi:AcrR family transcriptional regulator